MKDELPIATALDVIEAKGFAKLPEFRLKIQGGLLQNLGIKMYTKLGKVLVEFAANAFDSDSPSVDISFDLERITAAREIVRHAAKERFADRAIATGIPSDGKRRKAHVVVDPLPADITVVITDTGHGMTPSEIAERFLPLNRNRRKDASGEEIHLQSEAGRRFVMGRKGIGKLSAFGAADRVTVRSKRAGQTFWTVVEMVSRDLLDVEDLTDVKLPHSYEDASADEISNHGTTIILSELRCDAVNFKPDDIQEVLNETFYPIKPEEFAIKLNGALVAKIEPAIEYRWPEGLADDEYQTETLADDAWGSLELSYRVRFRQHSLPAEKRGAYIYSKGRLAAEPGLFGLKTGMHNFMAHQYMECLVLSDDIDNLNVDIIGTNRAGIIRNSDLAKTFIERVTAIMAEAIQAHGAFRDREAEKILDTASGAKQVREILRVVPSGQRKAARQLAKIFIAQYGAESEEFKDVAPFIMASVNAGQVLVDLIKVSQSPSTLAIVADKLVQLREIEKSDALKSYRARRNGIVALRKVLETGEENWIKGPQTEAVLHDLLVDNPWLIRPELASFVASDRQLGEVLDRLAKELKIGKHAAKGKLATAAEIAESAEPDKAEEAATIRPDLVSLIGDQTHPTHVLVVELKSPGLPMRIEHLNQLERYMRRVREYLQSEYAGSGKQVMVEGVLIGAMPDSQSRGDAYRDLLAKAPGGPGDPWEIIGLNELVRRTEAVHRDMIAAVEKHEAEETSDIDNSQQGDGTPAGQS